MGFANMNCKTFFQIIISIVSLWSASAAWSYSDQTAEEAVKSATVSIYRAIQEQCAEIERNPLHLHKLVEDILIPHADFERMARLALGKHWRTADPHMQSAFVTQFRHLLIRTYGTAVQMASLEVIKYLPARAGTRPGTMVVRTEIRRPGEAMTTINYYLYQKGNEWLVYDILIDGISLVSNYRTTFSEEIRKKGFSGLISLLETKNRRPATESNAELIMKRAVRACK